jgi:hypothetical protein
VSPNDGETFPRRGGFLRELRRRGAEILEACSFGRVRLKHTAHHSNVTVAAKGSYPLEFL